MMAKSSVSNLKLQTFDLFCHVKLVVGCVYTHPTTKYFFIRIYKFLPNIVWFNVVYYIPLT